MKKKIKGLVLLETIIGLMLILGLSIFTYNIAQKKIIEHKIKIEYMNLISNPNQKDNLTYLKDINNLQEKYNNYAYVLEEIKKQLPSE